MNLFKRLECLQISVFAVVLVYVLFSGLWILLSDRAVELLFSHPDTVANISKAKDGVFVAISSLLIYLSTRRLIGRLMLIHQREQQQPPSMLTSIAESSTDAIFAKDKEGRYLLVNNAAARFIGKPRELILGQDDHAVFPPEQARELMSIGRRVMETGQIETNEEVLHTSEGEKVFLATKGPLRDEEGKIFGIFGISRDITERKVVAEQLQRKEEKLRLLFEHSPAALAMFDCDMRYIAVSPKWKEDFGLGERNIIGLSYYEVSPETGPETKAIHERGLLGEVMTGEEHPIERLNGRIQWVRWEIRPWMRTDGSIGGVVIFTDDITERRNAEMETKLRTEELERFNRASVDRELDMIALKKRINELSLELGYAQPYDLSVLDVTPAEIRG